MVHFSWGIVSLVHGMRPQRLAGFLFNLHHRSVNATLLLNLVGVFLLVYSWLKTYMSRGTFAITTLALFWTPHLFLVVLLIIILFLVTLSLFPTSYCTLTYNLLIYLSSFENYTVAITQLNYLCRVCKEWYCGINMRAGMPQAGWTPLYPIC